MNQYAKITLDPASAEVMRKMFVSPMPMTGSASSKLSDLPTACDFFSARGSPKELAITTWNIQTHHYPSAISYRPKTESVGSTAPAAPAAQYIPTVLTDTALAQVVGMMSSLNNVQRRELLNSEGRYITKRGEMLYKMPSLMTHRSASFPASEALNIAKALDEGRLADEPPAQLPGSSDLGDSAPGTSRPHRNRPTTSVVADSAEKPAKNSTSNVIPVRVVKVSSMQNQGHTITPLPKSQAYVALESYASDIAKSQTQPYLPSARGVLHRDIPSIQEIINYVSSYNASHIDTAPALRGILYAYPSAPGAWDYDSYDRRIIRRQKDTT
ncbi:hypothetical protein JYU34_000196 [Plutella xylostella]|uniref:Uncharacterized protein n=1 Tax=Plutella xylostella TaxID=51655 RepID=A0ABQ7R775_PLUXY|nr:hypothetical protein JYU34_000196 [Plutella xylostella]